VVKSGGKYFYIDKTGKMVIESTFDAANPFSRGLALIWMGKREGIIDRTGNITWVSLD